MQGVGTGQKTWSTGLAEEQGLSKAEKIKSLMGLLCTSPNSQTRGKTGFMCPTKTFKGSALRFDPWPARSLGQGPSYHKRFCRTRFRVIYVSPEEPVETNPSIRQRLNTGPPLPVTWEDSAAW